MGSSDTSTTTTPSTLRECENMSGCGDCDRCIRLKHYMVEKLAKLVESGEIDAFTFYPLVVVLVFAIDYKTIKNEHELDETIDSALERTREQQSVRP